GAGRRLLSSTGGTRARLRTSNPRSRRPESSRRGSLGALRLPGGQRSRQGRGTGPISRPLRGRLGSARRLVPRARERRLRGRTDRPARRGRGVVSADVPDPATVEGATFLTT